MPAIFNQILVIDSIPAGELNSARRLYEDISVLAKIVEEVPSILFQRAESWGEITNILKQCAEHAKHDSCIPLVHIECHGSPDGLQFADGSRATWADMKSELTPLNIATKLNLIVVISACHGSSIVQAVQVTERAPVWGFIGPNHGMSAHDLEVAFSRFYRTILETRSSEEAAEAMRSTADEGAFMVLSSETIFKVVVAGYRKNFEGEEIILKRARALQVKAEDGGVLLSVEKIVEILKDPAVLESRRRDFFMIDLYPEHENRFSVMQECKF
jgi:hypothetical protein